MDVNQSSRKARGVSRAGAPVPPQQQQAATPSVEPKAAGKGSSWKHDLHRSFAAGRLVEVSIHRALADELYAAGKSKILPTMISKEAQLADYVAAGIRAADDRQGASSPCESRDDAQALQQALQQDRLV